MYDRKRIIRDVPYMMWVFGLGVIGVGIYGFITNFLPMIPRLIVIGVGLSMFLLPSILNVYVDRSRRILSIERKKILGGKEVEVQIDKIERIFVDRRVRRDSDGDRSTSYQVILILDTGERVPLRNSYSSSRRKQQKFAEIIREEIGLDHVDHAPESIGEALAMAMHLTPVGEQESVTGIAPGEHESNGVHWQMETFNFTGATGGSPVHRWSSTDVDTPNDFVFIVQRMEGVGQQRGLLKLAGKFLFKTSLQLYGFDEYYTPGIDQAQTVEDVDKRLVENFFVYTNNPPLTRQLLNPWMVMPLVGWSERYTLERGEKETHQLAVLFSPLGLYVSQLGKLDQAEIDELVALGIELVRAKR